MTENIYDRQQELIAPPRVVHIIGCGGVGTWAAIMLALAGVRHLHLYDDDVVDESNLNRLPYTAKVLGKPKLQILSSTLTKLRPDIELTLHGRFQPLLHKFERSVAVIGAVDTMSDRQIIYKACQESDAYYIDIGAEGHRCTVSDSPADWALVEDRAGYFTPIWVAPVVAAASLAVSAAIYRNVQTNQTFMLDLLNMEKETDDGISTEETIENTEAAIRAATGRD